MAVAHERAARIHLAERDSELHLDAARWPDGKHVPRGWDREDGYLTRVIEAGTDDPPPGLLAGRLREAILRFPSAPIHGIHRLQQYHFNKHESENFHTYRLLSHADYDGPVTRVFLLHNGLNELQKVGLYYQLASHLIAHERGTVCVLRPLPGHLTRSPFQAFSETPLDHYLWDGSNLFRQFLRYMIETQWFLSVLARRSSYRCPSGIGLLGEDADPKRSRLDDARLAAELSRAWRALHEVSDRSRERAHRLQASAPRLKEPPADDGPFVESVATLRRLLRYPRDYPGVNGDCPKAPATGSGPVDEPAVHVVGYSLGGFAAQSVFMSWPFMVSSCVTLLSGGALRELAPTAFADPEEWQTVLHSLRYELDDMLMETSGERPGESSDDGGAGAVAGIERELFLYLKRTFYEVFQQEYRGSFKTRVSAFLSRMLFIVGGNDPIVRPKSVLDSGPASGMNLLTIGGLGHFLGDRPQDDQERGQRTFWLPEVGNLVGQFADQAAAREAAARAASWLDEEMNLPRPRRRRRRTRDTSTLRRLDISERLAIEGDGALPSALFQRSLDDLLARVVANDRNGRLFILRNEVPTVLLDDQAIQEHAVSLYHDDASIAAYVKGVRDRSEILFENSHSVCAVLPWNARLIMETIDRHPGHPSQSESAGGQMPRRTLPEDTWRAFLDNVNRLTDEEPDAVRVFDGRSPLGSVGSPRLELRELKDAARKAAGREALRHVPSLPDCWVWVARDFLDTSTSRQLTMGEARKHLCASVPNRLADLEKLAELLAGDDVRIVTVSRARYNPRFRGRIIANPRAARHVLLHVALCLAQSVPLAAFDLDAGEPR